MPNLKITRKLETVNVVAPGIMFAFETNAFHVLSQNYRFIKTQKLIHTEKKNRKLKYIVLFSNFKQSK